MRHAGRAEVRSTATGLPGNTLNVDTLSWARYDSSVGAGIDSFYEYLLKVHACTGLGVVTCVCLWRPTIAAALAVVKLLVATCIL